MQNEHYVCLFNYLDPHFHKQWLQSGLDISWPLFPQTMTAIWTGHMVWHRSISVSLSLTTNFHLLINVNIILIPWIANYLTSPLLSPPIVHPCHSVPCPSTMACTSFHTPSTILFSNFLLLFHLMSRPFKCPTYFFEYHTPKLRPLPTAAFFLYDSYSNPIILSTSNHYRQLVLDSED